MDPIHLVTSVEFAMIPYTGRLAYEPIPISAEGRYQSEHIHGPVPE